LAKTTWRKRITAFLLPKSDKIPWRREPIAARGRFIVKDNALKDYRQRYPNDKLRQWAEEKRAKQLDEHGKPKWPAEIAVAFILDRLGVHYRPQFIMFRTGSFVILDFWLPGPRVNIELDGPSHMRQVEYDAGRDRWLRSQDIRPVHIPNATALRNPHACELIIMAELGL
jgi:very-short-patch-repair endonuclease